MMPQHKGPAPDFLRENYKTWGQEYAQKRTQKPNTTFRWKSYQGKPVNQEIRQRLVEITKDHCSYCDGYPLEQTSIPTIDHFRPKSKHPRLAYVWGNLFYCCGRCQSTKSDKFDRRLLKPDVMDYSFERYFIVNYSTGEIEINQAVPMIDRERAKLTIEIFALNAYGRPQSRLRQIKQFEKLSAEGYNLDDFSYRFCFI